MTAKQDIFRIRRSYNQWVANQTLEDFALRFTAKRARRWSMAGVANTALGSISFLALEAIGGAITLSYGSVNALAAVLVVGALLFLTGIPISYYAARYGVDIDLLTRGAGFGYIGSTVTSLIYASFTFIFFALEATILAYALEQLFGLPRSLGYLLCALVVIPLVTHGITLISRFQFWTQPVWIALQVLPFIYIGFADVPVFDTWFHHPGTRNGESGFDLLLFGAAATVIFALIAQIGEQVDFLRFIPEQQPGQRLRWWTAVLCGGPGWIIIGALKILGGSVLALLALHHGILPDLAADPTHMYTVAFGYVVGSPNVALAIAGIFVIVCQLKINVTNAYAGSIAWSNFFSRLTHSHPGRVVWLVFNVAIALMLMELGIYRALEEILGIYATVAVAWVGSLVADLVVNKPLGLSPPGIEFRRAYLYDINPVGVGSMVLASALGFAAHTGAMGELARAFSPFLAFAVALTSAPLIAWGTKGRFYIARPVIPLVEFGEQITCCICELPFEREDMAACPAYRGPICSLCCSLDVRCQDSCKIGSRFSQQLMALFGMILPARVVAHLNSRLGHFLGVLAAVAGLIGLLLFLVFLNVPQLDTTVRTAVGATLWQVYLILLIVTGVVIWLFVLAQESRVVAQEESQRQTRLLMEEIAAHERTDRALQRAKELAEAANLAKSRYLSGISHELRSPLNAVLGYAQLLEGADDIPPLRRDAVGVIRRSGEYLADLIEGLLDISKIEVGRLDLHRSEVRLPALVDQLVDMFRLQAQGKGIDFRFECRDRLPEYVRTDEKRLRQILINLLSNAIKFTERGSVSLTLRYRSQVAEFTVLDTGVGIAAEDCERIFRPFERIRKPGVPAVPGTGLGLTITRLLTDVMGGDLQLHSVPGEGSRFVLSLMLSSVDRPRPRAAPAQRAVGYRGPPRTVVVVDDDASHRGLISSMLTPLGFSVLEAADAEAALQLSDQCNADLFLLDVSMPGMNGFELADRLRARWRDVPIMMISADASEGRDEPDSRVHDDYIVKPLRLPVLLDKIAALLAISWLYDSELREAAARSRCCGPLDDLPADDLDALRRLAQIGYASGLHDKLLELRGSGRLDEAFVQELLEQVERFQFDQVIRTLEENIA